KAFYCYLQRNSDWVINKQSDGVRLGDSSKGILVHKGQGLGTRRGYVRRGRNLDKTIRDWGVRFKLEGSNQIPLSDTMNSIIKLISAQLEAKSGKAVMIIAGNLHKESTSQER
ncbi:hypothetical protein Gotur_009421, partial [Gossypium turneri]